MPGGIKISKPERLPKENVSEPDLYAWWNELMNYLNQHDNFKLFKERGMYGQWQPAETNEDRISALHKDDKDGKLDERQRDLHNFITIIAGCCSRDQYMMVIKQATSLKWIWDELTLIYQHQHKGKEFLSIVDLDYNPTEHTPLSFYNSYRAKVMENLKPAGTTVKWKNGQTLSTAETISPTFEDHILLTTLMIIDKKLPAKIKEVYGPRLEQGIFLMDLKVDILSNVAKILEDIETDSNLNALKSEAKGEYQVSYMGQTHFKRGRGRGRYNSSISRQNRTTTQNKFCRLCHLARQQNSIVLSHEIGDLECPSMSSRDRDGLKSKYSLHAAVTVEGEEEDMLEKMAQLHGYQTQVNNLKLDALSKEKCPPDIKTNEQNHSSHIHVIKPVPSQILTVYQNEMPVHIDLDTGCWISTVKLSYVLKMKWKLHPNGQLAKMADGRTVMESKGEIHEIFSRNSWTVKFSAIVMETLHTNVIGGNNFFEDNNIKQDISAKTISIFNKYVVPETNRHTDLPAFPINTIVSIPKATTLLPKQTLKVPVPTNVLSTEVLIEPVPGNKQCDIIPQICTVENGSISIENLNTMPINVKKNKLCVKMIRQIKPDTLPNDYKIANVKPQTCDNLQDITTNEHRLNQTQKDTLHEILNTHKSVFDQDLTQGYNQKSGPHWCKLKFANEERPSSRKVSCVQYNNQMNVLLQQVCDELTEANVLGIPQHENVDVQHVMPIFLRKKQKAKDKSNNELTTKDVRLVVNTCELSKYMKSLPGKISKPQDVYNALAKWKFIVKTDLYQGFFQNHLHKDAQKWCGILTPFGGLRFFKRGIQGLINQSEELDELLANLFRDMMTKGKLVKLADDLFTGGSTKEEALANLREMLQICQDNNIKLSPAKTVIMPITVDIMSWIWSEGGTLAPSPHRKQALLKVQTEDLKTVKDVRSWTGLYKTFLYHTPNLARIMDPFDKITGDKDSKDTVTWTNELNQAFQNAKDHVANIKEVYLPSPSDQLIIITDGARNPPGVGFVLQAKDQTGKMRTVRHYSVKLKPHHIKWTPCEIESVAFGTAIEAFYDIIKESTKPVIVCPDSKPVCDATKLLQKGKFSLSPRIQTFLNNMGKVSCEVQHISGKSGQNQIADFQSRNTTECHAEVCQLCHYVDQQSETIVDSKMNTMSSDIPYGSREMWANVQHQSKAINLARNALATGQLITKKSGKVNADARKITKTANIASDGLLVVYRNMPYSSQKEERIVVPTEYLPTLIKQLHNENNHPSKHQLKHLFEKYFFGVGVQGVIDTISGQCHTCCAMKKLPSSSNVSTTTTNAKYPGTHFGCDVMKRAKQVVIVIRDQFSSYTLADIIENENSDTLEDAIIKLLTPVRSSSKVIVRTDQAPGFVKAQKSKTLADLGIEIQTGASLNKNSNAVVDKAIQELEKEITAIQPGEKPIDLAILSKSLMSLNNRLRRNGHLSAKNILFSRDEKRQKNIALDDDILAKEQLLTREQNNEYNNRQVTKKDTVIKPGSFVMLQKNPKKHNIRDTYEVVDEEDGVIAMKKTNKNARNKVYKIPKDHLFVLPTKPYVQNKPTVQNRKPKYKEFDPIKRYESSDDDDISISSTESRREIYVSDDVISDVDLGNTMVNQVQTDVNIVNDNHREIIISDEVSTPVQRTDPEIGNHREINVSDEVSNDIANLTDANTITEINREIYISDHNSQDTNQTFYHVTEENRIDKSTSNLDTQQVSSPNNSCEQHREINVSDANANEYAALGARPKKKLREAWLLPKTTKSHEVLNRIKRSIAARTIQRWYKKHSRTQKHGIFLRPKKHTTPENLRNQGSAITEHILSTPEYDRCFSSTEETSKDTLDWDSEYNCTELYDEFNDAFLLPGLDLKYSKHCTDFMRVYDFSDQLPLPSELKLKKKKKFKLVKPLKSLRKKLKGGTPSRRQ